MSKELFYRPLHWLITSTHIWHRIRESIRATVVEGECSHHWATPAPWRDAPGRQIPPVHWGVHRSRWARLELIEKRHFYLQVTFRNIKFARNSVLKEVEVNVEEWHISSNSGPISDCCFHRSLFCYQGWIHCFCCITVSLPNRTPRRLESYCISFLSPSKHWDNSWDAKEKLGIIVFSSTVGNWHKFFGNTELRIVDNKVNFKSHHRKWNWKESKGTLFKYLLF